MYDYIVCKFIRILFCEIKSAQFMTSVGLWCNFAYDSWTQFGEVLKYFAFRCYGIKQVLLTELGQFL